MSDSIETAGGGEQAGGAAGAKQVIRRVVDALTDRQQRALALIGEGTSIKQISETVGVDRGTIYRWMRTDPHFRAAYNAWQLEQRESCRAALLKCAEKAVARINRMVDMDENLAWKLVKELGLLGKGQPMHTDAKQVEREIAIEQEEAENRLAERESDPLEEARETAITSMLQKWIAEGPASRPVPPKTTEAVG
ncbi:MAG TPA: helix-turn-helix domain-containing protein [Tepidisphaeraceae bacterium]|jgi:IS30 family transposase